MNRFTTVKSIAAAAIVLGAIGAASSAQAHTDVMLSIGIPAAFGYVQPAPVYTQPRVVYTQPQVVYTQPQVVYEEPVYVRPGFERGFERRHDERQDWRHARYVRENGPYGDRDHDCVPNRFDRFPSNPNRR